MNRIIPIRQSVLKPVKSVFNKRDAQRQEKDDRNHNEQLIQSTFPPLPCGQKQSVHLAAILRAENRRYQKQNSGEKNEIKRSFAKKPHPSVCLKKKAVPHIFADIEILLIDDFKSILMLQNPFNFPALLFIFTFTDFPVIVVFQKGPLLLLRFCNPPRLLLQIKGGFIAAVSVYLFQIPFVFIFILLHCVVCGAVRHGETDRAKQKDKGGIE